MIGQTKYYLDFKNKKISSGVVFAEQITQSGYDIYLLKTEKGVEQIECCCAYDTEDEAKEAFNTKMPIAVEMEKISNEAKKQIDKLRIDLIGKPKFKHLIGGNK